MQAATVTILVEKGEFKHETAVAIAEAIDVAIAGAGLVTVAVLDARLGELKAAIQTQIQELKAEFQSQIQEVRAEFQGQIQELKGQIQELKGQIQELKTHIQEVKAELVRWVFVVMLGNVAINAAATALLNALQHGH